MSSNSNSKGERKTSSSNSHVELCGSNQSRTNQVVAGSGQLACVVAALKDVNNLADRISRPPKPPALKLN